MLICIPEVHVVVKRGMPGSIVKGKKGFQRINRGRPRLLLDDRAVRVNGYAPQISTPLTISQPLTDLN